MAINSWSTFFSHFFNSNQQTLHLWSDIIGPRDHVSKPLNVDDSTRENYNYSRFLWFIKCAFCDRLLYTINIPMSPLILTTFKRKFRIIIFYGKRSNLIKKNQFKYFHIKNEKKKPNCSSITSIFRSSFFSSLLHRFSKSTHFLPLFIFFNIKK